MAVIEAEATIVGVSEGNGGEYGIRRYSEDSDGPPQAAAVAPVEAVEALTTAAVVTSSAPPPMGGELGALERRIAGRLTMAAGAILAGTLAYYVIALFLIAILLPSHVQTTGALATVGVLLSVIAYRTAKSAIATRDALMACNLSRIQFYMGLNAALLLHWGIVLFVAQTFYEVLAGFIFIGGTLSALSRGRNYMLYVNAVEPVARAMPTPRGAQAADAV